MKYLIVQDWNSTHGNHAGMVHMCKLLCEKYPHNYIMLVKNAPVQDVKPANLISSIKMLIKRIPAKISRGRRFYREYLQLCEPMFNRLTQGDEVFLLEYLLPTYSQYELAKYIKKHYPYVKLYGLAHMTPLWFDSHCGYKMKIKQWTNILDMLLTLGSSLSNYLETIGVPKHKISTGFHYVDNDYYRCKTKDVGSVITIIAIGTLQRNFNLLADIVNSCNDINWIICKGNNKIDNLFVETKNVRLVGYVDEEELKRYMSISDLSLNVLDDTVGSNVITTSMAMGLGIIVSDVGSIRDYCDESNAVFCNNTKESFVNEITKLSSNRDKVKMLKMNSFQKSSSFEISNIDRWFSNL